jgi:plasmid maintenance system antidote protein VapI
MVKQPKNPFHPGVTAGAALDLSDALGTSAKLRMNLQVTYDLDKAA